MWQQILTITWAEWRGRRNRLPRTSLGGVLTATLYALWFAVFVGLGIAAALVVPHVSLGDLRTGLPVALIVILFFWQTVPLITMSSGLALDLSKLQMYPIRTDTMFVIEVVLRLTTAPEMVLVVLGIGAGLIRHSQVGLPGMLVILFIPLNLFFSLGMRELLLHSPGRWRELLTFAVISLTFLPQIVMNSSRGWRLRPLLKAVSVSPVTPWSAVSKIALGDVMNFASLVVGGWLLASFFFARWRFASSLGEDAPGAIHTQRIVPREPAATHSGVPSRGHTTSWASSSWFTSLLRDPLGALVEAQFRSITRMPRFRVLYGMACVFSMLVFFPAMGRLSEADFLRRNFLPFVTLYSLLISGEVLVFNVFGFDRRAVQLYFAAPVPFALVLRAKNIVAVWLLSLQTFVLLALSALLQVAMTTEQIANAMLTSAVIILFYLGIGNLTSVSVPRGIDPNQTFRRQAGGRMQLWVVLSMFSMSVPLGFALLASWALHTNWAFVGVMIVNLAVGCVVFHIATESAVEKAARDTERIVDTLSAGSTPIGG